jgi:hypothetical protein
MGIDQFNDGHGAQQEKQDFSGLAKVVCQFSGNKFLKELLCGEHAQINLLEAEAVDKLRPMHVAVEVSRRRQQDKNAPANNGCEQRRRRFVDLERVLEYDG